MDEKEKKIAREVGLRLHLLRVKKNLSQEDLAKRLKCNQASISEWQSGKKLISTRYLAEVCDFFTIPWDFFNPQNINYVEHLKEKNNIKVEV